MEEPKERFLDNVIKELCSEMNIKLEKLSYGWILQLSKDGKVRHITRNHFDNNPQASSEIADDKYATYEVLKSQNVPVIEHTMLFNPATRSNYVPEEGNCSIIEREFSKYGALVVKPNDECQGQGVELCHTEKEIEVTIQKLFQKHSAISICPYYDIKTEYRTFYLNGEVLLIYGKAKPFVIGSGRATLEELIDKLELPDKKVVNDNLSKLDMTYIPKNDEKVEISWKHNLSGGSIPNLLEKGELYQEIEQLAIKTGKAMNMNFATIDIIQTKTDELYVLEVNSGVCATIFAKLADNGYEKVKEIYRKAIEMLF